MINAKGRCGHIKALILLMLIIIPGRSDAGPFPEMNAASKVTIKVIDEEGKPVESASIGVGYAVLSWGDTNGKSFSVDGYSDANGNFSASANASGQIGYTIKKDGYYDSRSWFRFQEIKNGKWEPWNPELPVVIRKIVNPVSMYARDTMFSRIEIPFLEKAVGFDLIEFDWVAPYGKGTHADFIFSADSRVVKNDDFDCTLTITFSNKFDGIQLYKEDRSNGSNLKLPRSAPETGYQPKMIRTRQISPEKGFEENCDDNNNYFFRVRSDVKDGKLVRAMYGKIQGDICPEPRGSKSVKILLKYFLNPVYTINMEYKDNLFQNLPSLEQVRWWN